MPIAKTKKELLEAIETEYRLLKKCIGGLGPDERELPGVCHEWSAKDVMAQSAHSRRRPEMDSDARAE
jgi:hypothetical protein